MQWSVKWRWGDGREWRSLLLFHTGGRVAEEEYWVMFLFVRMGNKNKSAVFERTPNIN